MVCRVGGGLFIECSMRGCLASLPVGSSFCLLCRRLLVRGSEATKTFMNQSNAVAAEQSFCGRCVEGCFGLNQQNPKIVQIFGCNS